MALEGTFEDQVAQFEMLANCGQPLHGVERMEAIYAPVGKFIVARFADPKQNFRLQVAYTYPTDRGTSIEWLDLGHKENVEALSEDAQGRYFSGVSLYMGGLRKSYKTSHIFLEKRGMPSMRLPCEPGVSLSVVDEARA